MGLFRKLFGGAEGVREAMQETYAKLSLELDRPGGGLLKNSLDKAVSALGSKQKALLTATIQRRYPREWGPGDCDLPNLFVPIIRRTYGVGNFI